MKVTKRGEYGLKVLLALACIYGQRLLSLREIALQERLPFKFLEQIMTVLKKAGFVASLKGKHGGYSLSRPPSEIFLGEVVRSIEGPLSPLATTEELKKEIQKGNRSSGLYDIFLEVRNAIAGVLDHKTLADVCGRSQELAAKTPYEMYYI